MILKSMSRKSNPTQLIHYALRYQLKEKHSSKNKEEATLVLTKNLRSRSIEGIVKEFKLNESFRIHQRKNAVVLYHDVLSFNPSDKNFITDEFLRNFANKYASLRSPQSLCLVVAHRNKTAHTHLHAVVSGVKLNGTSSRISKKEFKQIVNELETYQREKYPELTHSKNEHGKTITKTKDEILEHVKKTRQTTKEKLINALDNTYIQSKSSKDFLNRLSSEYELYYRNGRLQGIMFDSKKYRIAKLGYDDERIQSLNQQISFKEKSFLDLQNIRQIKSKKLEREMFKKETKNVTLQNEVEQKLLDEINSIRQQQESRQVEELSIERTRCLDESNLDHSTNELGTDGGLELSTMFDFIKPKFIENDLDD